MQFMDVMAPLAALHIIYHPKAALRLLTPSVKLVLNLPTLKGWKDESSSRVPRPGVEPGPLASEASVLPLDHLLSCLILLCHINGDEINNNNNRPSGLRSCCPIIYGAGSKG